MVLSSAGLGGARSIAAAVFFFPALLAAARLDAQLTSVRFELSTVAADVGSDSGVQAFTLADVNGDDRDDLVSIDRLADEVLVYLAREDGTFESVREFDVLVDGDPERPTAVAVGDVGSSLETGDGDTDGNPDIVVATEDGSVAILVGDGNGRFEAREELIDPGFELVGLALGDLDEDSKLDVVALDQESGLFVLLNQNGNFDPDVDAFETEGDEPIDVAIADIDGDDSLDVVVLNRNTETVSLLIGDGDGGLSTPNLRSTSSDPFDDDQFPTDLAIADLDDDGNADVVLVNSGQLGDLQLLVRRGPDLRDQSAFSAPFRLRGLTVANFDDDSFPDVVLVSEVSGDGGVFLGDDGGAGGFLDVGGFIIRGIPGSRAVVSGDIDGDGRSDFVSLNLAGNEFSVALNEGVVIVASPTSLPTATATATPLVSVTPTDNGGPSPTAIPTPAQRAADDDSCAIVPPGAGRGDGSVLFLLLPPALLLWRKRKEGAQ